MNNTEATPALEELTPGRSPQALQGRGRHLGAVTGCTSTAQQRVPCGHMDGVQPVVSVEATGEGTPPSASVTRTPSRIKGAGGRA